MSPDPYVARAGPSDPKSWNPYAYVLNDPVNHRDPAGTGCDEVEYGADIIVICSDPSGWDPSAQWVRGPNGEGGGFRNPGPTNLLSNPQAVAGAVAHTAAKLAAAEPVAIKALEGNPNCAGLFNLDPNAPDPGLLLQDIASGQDPQAYFTEEFIGPNPNNPNVVVNAETLPTSWSLQNGVVVHTNQANKVVVAFNFWPNAPFNSGSAITDAITILHELGHLEELLYGPGSTLLVNDSVQAQGSVAASNAASAFNTQLVKTNCFPGSH